MKSTLLPSGNRQATFLSPNKSSPNKRLDVGGGHSGLALPQSFLAKNSPQQIQKAESRIVCHHLDTNIHVLYILYLHVYSVSAMSYMYIPTPFYAYCIDVHVCVCVCVCVTIL